MSKKCKIGIDIDNVLSNFNEELLKEFLNHDKELRNTGIIDENAYITKGMFDWSTEELDDFYNNNIERIAKNLKVIDEAPEYIKKLKENGYEIYIITARGSFLSHSADVMSIEENRNIVLEWLKKNNINYDKIIFSPENKLEICLENDIDLMIEDKVDNINKISKKIPVICFNVGYNKECEGKNIIRCYSWYDIYAKIKNIKKS